MNSESPFLVRLAEGPILADGGMGTLLFARGYPMDSCLDGLVLSDAAIVCSIHEDYLRAGAQVITTNTFGATRMRLAQHGLGTKVSNINLAAARLARQARERVGTRAFVAGSIGPIGAELDRTEFYEEQAVALRDGGIELYILETMVSIAEANDAINSIRSVSSLPIIAQFTFSDQNRTPAGETPEDVGAFLERSDVNVVGVNCSAGPQSVLAAIERLSAVVTKPISALPSAGLPKIISGHTTYSIGPDEFAKFGARFLRLDVRVLGGCCGTTPEYISGMQPLFT